MDGITDSMDMGFGRLRQLMMDREAWRAEVHGVTKSRTRLSHLTELGYILTFAPDKWLFLSILVQVLLKCFFFSPLLIHKLSTLTYRVFFFSFLLLHFNGIIVGLNCEKHDVWEMLWVKKKKILRLYSLVLKSDFSVVIYQIILVW